jgi:hypothetical protein
MMLLKPTERDSSIDSHSIAFDSTVPSGVRRLTSPASGRVRFQLRLRTGRRRVALINRDHSRVRPVPPEADHRVNTAPRDCHEGWALVVCCAWLSFPPSTGRPLHKTTPLRSPSVTRRSPTRGRQQLDARSRGWRAAPQRD